MTRPALKLAVPPLSPERQALADAIAEAGPLRMAADKARVAAEAARGALAKAREAGPVVERAAEEARARLVADPTADRCELRRLRAAVTDAADDLSIARDVAERAEAELTNAERAARYAQERIEAAAGAVLIDAYPALIEAAERAARDAAHLAFAAQWVASNGNPFDGEATRLKLRAEVLNPHIAFGRDGNAAEAARHAAIAPWHASRAALLDDPAASLPEVP